GMRISRPKNGMVTMSITDTQRRIIDFEKTLDAIETSSEPRSKALLEAFWKHIDGGGGVLKPEYRTVIAIGLDQSATIIRGEGDESIIGASDGTTMTGAEIVNLAMSGALGDKIYAGLFHPTAGPVNLYEARFASGKQRILAMAENLVCPWPDCKVPADRCQVHHIDAHKNGGQTNPSNLTTLCSYHNGVNDDGARDVRHEKSRGRMIRHRGQVKLVTPGGKLLGNTHDLSTMGAMDLI
ncbi:MAG: HNH endonuclease, partial [Corynebacterium casei]|uniref:HNH endonuclease signature motif containing protein n=2 Tax=Corynebacterium casei TaxID=160386 RepID=UPI0026489AC5